MPDPAENTQVKSHDGEDQKPQDPKPAQKEDGKLGDAGLSALQKERDARKQLERDLQKIRDDQASTFSALAEALGVTPQGGQQAVTTETLQQQINELNHGRLVDRVARNTGITDPDDLALLSEQRTEDSMLKLAARLQAVNEPRNPKPDPTQGGAGKPAPLNGTGIEDAMKRALGLA